MGLKFTPWVPTTRTHIYIYTLKNLTLAIFQILSFPIQPQFQAFASHPIETLEDRKNRGKNKGNIEKIHENKRMIEKI